MIQLASLNDYLSETKSEIDRLIRRYQFDKKEQLKFLTTFERLLRRLNATKAIGHMAKSSHGMHKRVCDDVAESIQAGGTIADGLEPWFDPVVVQGIRIGEERDVLLDSVKVSIATQKLSAGNIFSAVSSLAYPAIIFVVCGVVALFLKARLFPLIEDKVAKMGSVPMEVFVIQALSSFWSFWVIPTTIVLFGFIIIVIHHLNNSTDDGRSERDQLPIFYEFRQLKVIFFLRMFSMLKKYNMTDLAALNSLDSLQRNRYLGWHIGNMKDAIQDGNSLAIAIDTGLINKDDVLTLMILADDADKDGFCEAIDTTIEGVIENVKFRIAALTSVTRYILFIFSGYLVTQLVTFVLSIDKYLAIN